MRVLVLGGSRLLGGAFVKLAVKKGIEVTVFNRGRTNPGQFENPPANLRLVHGDREIDLQRLEGLGDFDAVIDTSAYTPTTLKKSLDSLNGRFGTYVFVSTISVYDSKNSELISEEYKTYRLQDSPYDDKVTPKSYGYLKAGCEQLLQEMRVPALVLRPGIMIGPSDHTKRFQYWLKEIMQKEAIDVPGSPERVIQLIDSRDIAVWMLECLERSRIGIFNCAGEPRFFESMLKECASALGRLQVKLNWMSNEEFDSRSDVKTSALPLFNDGLSDHVSSAKAVAFGLRYRSLTETVRDIEKNHELD